MLSQRILVLFVLIGATPAMVLGLVLFVMVRTEVSQAGTTMQAQLETAQVRQINARGEALVRRLAERLDERVAGRRQSLRTLAHLIIDTAEPQLLLDAYRQVNPWVQSLRVEALEAGEALPRALTVRDESGEVASIRFVQPLPEERRPPRLLVAIAELESLYDVVEHESADTRSLPMQLRVVTQAGDKIVRSAGGRLVVEALSAEGSLSSRELELSGSIRRGTHLISYAHTTYVDWRVEAAVPIEAALEPTRHITDQLEHTFSELLFSVRTYSLVIILAFLLLAALAARLVGRDIVEPIDEVVDGIGRIANGYLRERVPVRREDELGFLAGAVNKMAEELQASKQELARSRDHSEHLMRSLMDALLVVNLEGRVTACNPTASDILGYSAAELTRLPLEQVIEPRVGEAPVVERLLAGQELDNLDAVLVTSYGARLPVLLSSSALADEEQQHLGFTLIARDITDQLQVEEERRRLAAIVQGSADLIATLSTSGDILFPNAAGREMLNVRDTEQLLGCRLIDVCHGDDGAHFVEDVLPEILREGHLACELQLHGFADGEPFPVHVHFTLIADPNTSEPAIISAIAHDITERKRVLTQLRHYAQELEASNLELERFAFVASHDLREPLRKLHNFSQLLSRRYADQLDDKGEQILHFISASATRMLSLIKDLLAYSRVGTQKQPFEAVSCEDVMASVREDLSMLIREKGARIEQGPLPTVTGDPDQLAMVFRNLLGNALKFHGDQPPVVHINARRQPNAWAFSVRDEGMGIEPAHREKIFVIFQRLHPEGGDDGTGIGLAICRKIIERHGGKIWVESTIGKGATFHFTLPLQPKLHETHGGFG